MIRELWSQRELIFTLVKRDLKIRYKSSAFGFLWSFGRPLAMMLILWVVFSKFARIPTAHESLPYALHVLTGLLPWMFVTGALFEATGSIFANQNIVKKISVPAGVFPATAVLGNLVHFLLAMMVLFVFIAFAPVSVGWEIILLPLLVVLQTAMLFGFALMLSALVVRYRDVGSIAEIGITMWFYLTPIIYPIQLARDQLRASGLEWAYKIYLLNPMTPIVCAYRRVLYGPLLRYEGREIDDQTLLVGLGFSTAFTAILLLVALATFKRMSRSFADEL